MVYFRMMPLGFAGGSQDTTTLLADEGTALMPAGGPGTAGARGWQSRQRDVPAVPARCRAASVPTVRWGAAAAALLCQHCAGARGTRSAGHPTITPPPRDSSPWAPPVPAEPEAGGLTAAQALL